MAVTDLIGAALPSRTVVVERTAVGLFASAVTDANPVFHDAAAAAAAGFPAIPAPPTFAFAMHHLGAFPELQPEQDTADPLSRAIQELMADGGLLLHGEQGFTYVRPVQVGDRLTSSGRIADITTRLSSEGRTMTFLVTETDWYDENHAPVVSARMTLIHRA